MSPHVTLAHGNNFTSARSCFTSGLGATMSLLDLYRARLKYKWNWNINFIRIPFAHIVKPVNSLWGPTFLMSLIKKKLFPQNHKILSPPHIFIVCSDCWIRTATMLDIGRLEDDQTNFEHKRWFHEIKVILRNKEGVESTLFASICCNQTFPSRHQVLAVLGKSSWWKQV